MRRTITIIDHGKDYGFGRYAIQKDGDRYCDLGIDRIREILDEWIEDGLSSPERNAHVAEPFREILDGIFNINVKGEGNVSV